MTRSPKIETFSVTYFSSLKRIFIGTTVACLGGGGGLGCSSTPLAQAVQYIFEASGNSPASPGFSKRDHFFSKYYAWHGTSKYFVGTGTCHCLCAIRDYYRLPLDPELFADRNEGVVSRQHSPHGAS